MSGGFFRGTSADQDTRFSNKQAKLLKSQKFAPELENLVDMSKVNMDVMRPWIAKRVTELIGFEDEVLINFIYGLLEGKAVNGKEIQISLTGFMERNTGKFMKELWALLLSAQQNVSGIPQQFLDAKEEETKKKKAETDRIANEIHKNKEKERLEFEQEKKRMGGEDSMSRDTRTEVGIDVKHDGREFSIPQEDDKERIKRNGRKEHRVSRSPDSTYQSRSPRRKHSSASPSKSSNSRSRSNERGRSRSTSGGPPSRSRSISSERQRHPGRERSATPIRRRNVRRSPSPRPAPLHSKRRSTSHSRYRSPSPARPRVRSPVRRRSRSPMRRRSRSPLRRRSRSHFRRRSRTPVRRSPLRYRSRTPLRRRSPSPIRRRSPSPRRRRSPSPRRRRSPSPIRRRSPSPIRRRSPSPTRRRSPSPVRRRSPSPVQRRSPSPVRRRSPSPVRRRSPSPVRRRSPSPVHRSRSPIRRKSPFVSGKSPSPVYHSSPSPRHRRLASPTRRSSPPLRHKPSPTRRQYQRSPANPRQQSVSPARGRLAMRDRKRSSTPVRQTSTREESSSPLDVRHGSHSPIERGSMRSMRSPIQSPRGRTRRHDNYSPARRASPGERVEIPVENRKGVRSAGSKPAVSLRSPQRDTLDQDDLHEKDQDLLSSVQKSPVVSHFSRSKSDSDEQRAISPHGSHETFDDGAKLKNRNSEKVHDRMVQKEPDVCQELSGTHKTTGLGVKGMENSDDDGGARGKGNKTNRADESKRGHQLSQQETSQKLSRNPERNNQNGSWNSPSKEADEGRIKVKEKRKHKKSDSQEIESDDYSSDDSYEERKEAKKRRREEKKMKKEKRRRRREEKRRRKEERRAEKLKSKSGDSDSSSSEDPGRRHAENDKGRLRDSRASKTQETEFDQKKLEIELREKALETLRAKKGFGN